MHSLTITCSRTSLRPAADVGVMWHYPQEHEIINYLPFKIDHLEKASIVYTTCFNGPPWHDGWTLEAAKERLRMLLDYPNAIGLVAIRNEEVVGLVIGNCEP